MCYGAVHIIAPVFRFLELPGHLCYLESSFVWSPHSGNGPRCFRLSGFLPLRRGGGCVPGMSPFAKRDAAKGSIRCEWMSRANCPGAFQYVSIILKRMTSRKSKIRTSAPSGMQRTQVFQLNSECSAVDNRFDCQVFRGQWNESSGQITILLPASFCSDPVTHICFDVEPDSRSHGTKSGDPMGQTAAGVEEDP